MKNILQDMKDIEIIEPVITIKSTMTDDNLEQMKNLADEISMN